jgi:lipid-binding SYLF domain-containing protein
MTDGHYEQAVNILATLIVGWATGGEQGSAGVVRPSPPDTWKVRCSWWLVACCVG